MNEFITRGELEELLQEIYKQLSKLGRELKESNSRIIDIFESKVIEFQGQDFEEWKHWEDKLKEVDPRNPLLQKDFHGLSHEFKGGD